MFFWAFHDGPFTLKLYNGNLANLIDMFKNGVYGISMYIHPTLHQRRLHAALAVLATALCVQLLQGSIEQLICQWLDAKGLFGCFGMVVKQESHFGQVYSQLASLSKFSQVIISIYLSMCVLKQLSLVTGG